MYGLRGLLYGSIAIKEFCHEQYRKTGIAEPSALARLYDALSSLRRGESVWALSQGRRSLPGLQRGFHPTARRRFSGVSCHRTHWTHHHPGSPAGGGDVRATALAAISDLAAVHRVWCAGFTATDQGRG